MTQTLIEAFAHRVHAAQEYNPNVLAPPVAVLWPDRNREWEPLLPELRRRLPILTLGEYDVEARTGPAYWVRCAIACEVPVEGSDGVPVLYLPGVAREDLRAIEECPAQLAPIAELQYRSEWFTHPNGRDWTLRGFLSNAERGFGLAVADDAATTEALARALLVMASMPLARLEGRYLDAEVLTDLVSPDHERLVLEWLDDPAAFRARSGEAAWSAFALQCKTKLGFEVGQGELDAARRLGEQHDGWALVWQRFREAPERYPGIPNRLRAARPGQLFTESSEAWPQDNEEQEQRLRDALAALQGCTRVEASDRVRELEAEHGLRRGWVWAELGSAPLAYALSALVRLADACQGSAPDGPVSAIAEWHAAQGWMADDAAVSALAEVAAPEDLEAVGYAVDAIYREWARAGALALQQAVGPHANAGTYVASPPPVVAPGELVLFVDGLRFDLGRALERQLTGAGADIEVSASLAALPTVTPTAKPAVSPVAAGALCDGSGLSAARTAGGVPATVAVLRKLLEEQGFQILGHGESGDPTGTAWAEAGEIDHRGHDVGIGLVRFLPGEIDRVATRALALLDAGWKRIHIVTDHGWLLFPSPLEKSELKPALTDMKKGRCARLKDGATFDGMTVPWYWSSDVRVAIADGIACFEQGKTYEHGGVSPQECVVPRLVVTRSADAGVTSGPRIADFKWLGLQCRIEFSGAPPGSTLDLRSIAADPATSVAFAAKETAGQGRALLGVRDDGLEGQPAKLVLLASNGEILAQRDVTIGE